MAFGHWYAMAELRELTGDATSAVVSSIKTLRRRGELFTRRDAGNGRYEYRRVVVGSVVTDGVVTKRRVKHPLEELPLEQVTRHLPVVGWNEVWRGKTWRDMPGHDAFFKRCNFFLWRRGRLKYDLATAPMGGGALDRLRERGLVA
ncbi:MAG: hypothetical protein QM496_01840 [Verrucomicrobiota bacterium]